MGARIHDVTKRLQATVGEDGLVTLELTVRVHFTPDQPISCEQEHENHTRLMNSHFRHEVAAELERLWRGPAESPADPEKGAPDLDIDAQAHTEPTPASPPDKSTIPFQPNRRGNPQARTPQQQIVQHLEGPRFGFKPEWRPERLAFTAWLARMPGQVLGSTNELSAAQALDVLKQIRTEKDPATLMARWEQARDQQLPPSSSYDIDAPLNF